MNDNKTIGKIKTPSKINLYLKVTGKREDGYHEIESLFVPLSEPSDKITVSEICEKDILITSDSSDIPLDESNICYKAAEEFAKFADIEPCWNIYIEKHIPVAAGLGGGSSDAAAVLKILNDNVKAIGQEQLAKLAKSIGADVPFFLNPTPSIGTGIGDKLEPVDLRNELDFVLVNPLFPVNAKWGYEQLKITNYELRIEENYSLKYLVGLLNKGKIPELIVNDLAPAVYEKFPIMEIMSEQMKEYGADCVGMTGSGPTLFGLCKDGEAAANLAKKIKEEYGRAIWITKSELYHKGH